jgi:hypothetical protein
MVSISEVESNPAVTFKPNPKLASCGVSEVDQVAVS